MSERKLILGGITSAFLVFHGEARGSAGMQVQEATASLRELSHILQRTQVELDVEQKNPRVLEELAAQSQALADTLDSPPQDIRQNSTRGGTLFSRFELPRTLVIASEEYECVEIRRRIAIVRKNLTNAARIARRAAQLAEQYALRSSQSADRPDQAQMHTTAQAQAHTTAQPRRSDEHVQQSTEQAQHPAAADAANPDEILAMAMKEVTRLEAEIESIYPSHFDEKNIAIRHTWNLGPFSNPNEGEPTDESDLFEPLSIAINGYTWHAGEGTVDRIPGLSLAYDVNGVHAHRIVSLVDACASELSMTIVGTSKLSAYALQPQKITLVGTVE